MNSIEVPHSYSCPRLVSQSFSPGFEKNLWETCLTCALLALKYAMILSKHMHILANNISQQ